MRRTTLTLPDKLMARAEQTARARGVSLRKLIQSSLEAELAITPPARPSKRRRPRSQDPLFADTEVFHDHYPANVSENVDKYLTDILVEDYEREQRR